MLCFLLLFSSHCRRLRYGILLFGPHISALGLEKKLDYRTEQEEFWSGEFGNSYTERNASESDRVAKQIMFSQMIRNVPRIESVVELGCNIGLNLWALKTINSNFEVAGYEINKNAVIKAKEMNVGEIFEESVITK